MLYTENFNEETLNIVMSNYNIIFKGNRDDIVTELNVDLDDEKKGSITMHLLPNGIRKTPHGLRIKVIEVDGKSPKGSGYEFPINQKTGVVTADKSLMTNEKIGRAISKTIAAFAKENLDILNKYNGYRDDNNRIIDGDENAEKDIIAAVKNYNALSKREKMELISKGEIKNK